MFAAVVAAWVVYIVMDWTEMLLPPHLGKSTDCPIRLKRFKLKVGVRWPRTFSRLLRSLRKTTLTDLQHIQNLNEYDHFHICISSNKIFTSYLLVPLQIIIITITNVLEEIEQYWTGQLISWHLAILRWLAPSKNRCPHG